MRLGRHRGQGQRRRPAIPGAFGLVIPVVDENWTAGGTDNGVNLPTVKLDTTFSLNGGTTHNVANASELATALTNQASQNNPLIVLTADFDSSTTFDLPVRTGTGTCQIISSNFNTSTPPKAPGKRVVPADASNMKRIRTTVSNTPIFRATHGATHPSHYRFIGLELTSTASQQQALFMIDGSTSTDANLCDDIGIDRCYIHGAIGSIAMRRGCHMDGTNTYIIDSTISEFHEAGAENHALLYAKAGANHKIVNNYLSATSINILVGGDTSSRRASNMEIRFNHIDKPAAWEALYTDVKNLIELKLGDKILIEGNVIEGSWTQGQTGMALSLQSISGINEPQYKLTDCIVRWNKIMRYDEPFRINGGNQGTLEDTLRVLVHDNLFVERRTSVADGRGHLNGFEANLDTIIVKNNTIDASSNFAAFNTDIGTGGDNLGLTFEDNLTRLGGGTTSGPIWGSGLPSTGGGAGTGCLDTNWTGYSWTKNGHHGGTWSTGIVGSNTVNNTGTWNSQFVDQANGDYTIANTSAFKGCGTGGRDPGPNITSLTSRLQYTLTGQRPSAP